jgi:pimeloyl-ACP methyl ester carboxylesterase
MSAGYETSVSVLRAFQEAKTETSIGGENMKTVGILVLVGVLFQSSNAVTQTGGSVNTELTIVFVHGLWADGSSWNKVINPLVDKGYKVISVQNPTTSLEDDVTATKRAIDRANGNVVLVGHSWGGSVITEAGADPRVKALVYIAAFAPDKGETAASLGESAAPTILPGFIQNANGYLTLSREGVAKAFAGDLSPKEQDVVYAVQQPAFQRVFSDVGVNAAWKTKPSWYVVASEDNAINPELEKRMATRANAKTTTLKSSHVAMLSKPNEVLDVILDAAKSVSK